jgi:exodeoxyribonuclease V alpha subunit
MTQHYTMLQRNLLYTAITRARKLCVLAGIPRAISMAVRNNKVAQRFTALEWRLAKWKNIGQKKNNVFMEAVCWEAKK